MSSHLLILLENPSLHDLHFLIRPVLLVGLDKTHALDDTQTALDATENSVLPIEPGCGCQGDKKLAAIGVGPTVGHAQDARAGVLERSRDLVFEFFAVDGLASATGTGGVAGLDHEVGDDAVEDDIVVVSALGKGSEVFAGTRGMVVVEFDDDVALELC